MQKLQFLHTAVLWRIFNRVEIYGPYYTKRKEGIMVFTNIEKLDIKLQLGRIMGNNIFLMLRILDNSIVS